MATATRTPCGHRRGPAAMAVHAAGMSPAVMDHRSATPLSALPAARKRWCHSFRAVIARSIAAIASMPARVADFADIRNGKAHRSPSMVGFATGYIGSPSVCPIGDSIHQPSSWSEAKHHGGRDCLASDTIRLSACRVRSAALQHVRLWIRPRSGRRARSRRSSKLRRQWSPSGRSRRE